MSARFGKLIADHEQGKTSVPLSKLDPEDGCTDSIKPVGPLNLRLLEIFSILPHTFNVALKLRDYYFKSCRKELKILIFTQRTFEA